MIDMAGWHVNYYSVTRRAESRSASCLTFDGALVHARALTINGHIVRSVTGPHGATFDAGQLRSERGEKLASRADRIDRDHF
ncbi:hypothetical protein [Rhodoblastus sp.]|uniref:hypothetical protein n=1 Tax=Rhodoblastus sp. TaxID=1962975 RepID=UPI0025D4B19B|nr:hypothetical protein [Rhodoblastus sp.]